MAAGGLNSENLNTDVLNTLRAAIEMNDFMLDRKAKCISNNQPYFEMREVSIPDLLLRGLLA